LQKELTEKGNAISYIGHIITGLCALLFLISLGLCVVLFFRQLYYYDIGYLNIVESSGFSKEEILKNYNSLIDWCMPWVSTEFSLPTFPSSNNAIIHFAQVKTVFNAVLCAGLLGGIALIPLLNKKSNTKSRYYIAGAITLAIPTTIGIYAAFDFNKAFVLFHKIVFRNDLWIFNYKTDPVIEILPEAFFMHCAIVIIGVVLVGAVGLFVLGRRRNL